MPETSTQEEPSIAVPATPEPSNASAIIERTQRALEAWFEEVEQIPGMDRTCVKIARSYTRKAMTWVRHGLPEGKGDEGGD